MSALPNGWAATDLGTLVNYGTSSKVEPSDLHGDEWILELEDIEKDTSRLLQRAFVRDRRPRSTKNRFFAGDVLYGKLRPNLNKVLIADHSGICTTEILPLRCPEGVEAKFIFYTLRSPGFIEYVTRANHGLDMPRLGTEAGRKATVLLAPANEQNRIVAKLDNLTARLSHARDELDRIPKLIERYKQAILAKAFSGELTADWRRKNLHKLTLAKSFLNDRQLKAIAIANEPGRGRDEKTALLKSDNDLNRDLASLVDTRILPSQWSWAGLGQVFGVYVGATPSRKESKFWNGTIPWVSSGEVAFCRIISTEETITQAGLDKSSTRLHPKGTVLLGMIGEGKTRGQAAILDISACNNQNCAAIRVAEAEYLPEYVYWYLYFAYQQTRTTGAGNNQPALNKERVQRLPIPLAPPEEAKVIADAIATAFAWLDKVVQEHSSAKRLLTKLDQAILTKAFRGELVPQDPNDEPASALLERIKKNAAKCPPKTRSGTKRN